MCGRFAQYQPEEVVVEHFSISSLHTTLSPRYNIAPEQDIPVVRRADSAKGGRELVALRWGLVPFWAGSPGDLKAKMINARSETAHEKPAFRAAFSRRRCIIPASGFFEWKEEQGGKQPYFIRPEEDRPVGFAGLWEHWEPEDEDTDLDPVESCTILTTEPNSLVEPLHDRMPVILSEDEYAGWLDQDAEKEELRGLLDPASPDGLRAYPVTKKVGNPQYNTEECVDPVGPDLQPADPPEGEQQSLL